ncbi:Cornichon family protein [Arabidopsis thaliana]|uniref:Cornichon family protein n=1 Tax=Arabidopsis thaliana TaxID=3702 RepID=B3H584_ARATH|nr:Cornichon family protein [Arabidopsis thaliana]AEE34017.1 Cornichon family protein [Arabidopsis thaliana]|eukprot:NP_001117536.1 Cornichon family protein [Arabidopsis thaliana]
MGEVWTWIISFLILITLLGLIVYQVLCFKIQWLTQSKESSSHGTLHNLSC